MKIKQCCSVTATKSKCSSLHREWAVGDTILHSQEGAWWPRENGKVFGQTGSLDGAGALPRGSCRGLNENDPHRLTGSGTIRRCGFAGVGVASLEEVCH